MFVWFCKIFAFCVFVFCLFHLYNYFIFCYHKLVCLWPFDWLTLGYVVKVAVVAPYGELVGDGDGIEARVVLSRKSVFESVSLRASLELGSSSSRTN